MPVRSDQRYKASNPCPICGGHEALSKRHGQRCWGFQVEDWAICTREEMSGGLPDKGYGSRHRLTGSCGCGNEHGGWSPPTIVRQNRLAHQQDSSRYARRLWEEAGRTQGTVVETYMKSRGITATAPPALRFHPSLKHRDSGKVLPAMVAVVTTWPGTYVVAIHRTYLRPDGSAKADVDPDKMSLGPIRGGAVCLGPPAPKMAITEGIEDGTPGDRHVGMGSDQCLGDALYGAAGLTNGG